jgi:hypothetical protein
LPATGSVAVAAYRVRSAVQAASTRGRSAVTAASRSARPATYSGAFASRSRSLSNASTWASRRSSARAQARRISACMARWAGSSSGWSSSRRWRTSNAASMSARDCASAAVNPATASAPKCSLAAVSSCSEVRTASSIPISAALAR